MWLIAKLFEIEVSAWLREVEQWQTFFNVRKVEIVAFIQYLVGGNVIVIYLRNFVNVKVIHIKVIVKGVELVIHIVESVANCVGKIRNIQVYGVSLIINGVKAIINVVKTVRNIACKI
jgi:hypothetical protein